MNPLLVAEVSAEVSEAAEAEEALEEAEGLGVPWSRFAVNSQNPGCGRMR